MAKKSSPKSILDAIKKRTIHPHLTKQFSFLFINPMLMVKSKLILLLLIVVLSSCVKGIEEVRINDDTSGYIVTTYKLPRIALRKLATLKISLRR